MSRIHFPNGFSLVELLIALTISSLVTAAVAAMVPASRAAFEETPAALDTQQRGRTIVDSVARAVRSAGIPGFVPAVVLSDPDPAGERFSTLLTITRRLNGAEGVLEEGQAGASGELVLSATRCPVVADVCGFARGATVVIADGAGRFDLFTVGATSTPTNSISSENAFAGAYPAGAIVAEVEAYTFRLDPQPDGSRTLVRETVAGAIQPIVDEVSELTFRVIGATLDTEVGLRSIGPSRVSADRRPVTVRTAIFMRNAS